MPRERRSSRRHRGNAVAEPLLALQRQVGSGSTMDEPAGPVHADASDGAGARQPLPLGCLCLPHRSNVASLRLAGWSGPR